MADPFEVLEPVNDPSTLPEMMVERIFGALPITDILSCCLVSSQWREAVNTNIIWKKFCDLSLDLENKPCIVEPKFQPPLQKSDLSMVCRYRLNYMREVHLRNNFKHNRFKDYRLPRIKNFQEKAEFLGNYLLLNDSYKYMFQVWDIEGEPCLVESVPYLLDHMYADTFHSAEGHLLLVQCNLLQVYSVVDSRVFLKLCRVFDREEEFSEEIPSVDKVTSWYSTNIGLYPCDFSSINETVANHFVGVVECSQPKVSVIHIWDFTTGRKLKQETIPGSESAETICCGKNSKCLFIVLYLGAGARSRCKILCYSLQTLQYTQFYVESGHSIPFMLFEEQVVLLPCDQWEESGTYTLLDAATGKTVAHKKYENPINPKAVDVHNSLLVFGSSNTVTIVDLNSGDVVNCFTVDYEVMEVYLLDCNLLLVGGVDYHFVLQLWDITKTRKLYSLDEKSILLQGRSLSTLCLQSIHSIHIHHFW